MMLVRPVTMSDHAEILALAHEAGIGMTSLPEDAGVLKTKIENAVASFAGSAHMKGDERFLFVLEDVSSKKLVGTAGVVAHVGIKHPFYSYKLSTIVQSSDVVGVYSLQKVLHMVNDYTGASEIGSLFLLPDYRRDGIGKFLSRCRYLFMAQFPELFSDTVISEIRGVQDENGDSPFYRNLAGHFFQMDFKKADFITATKGGQFISDLMPRYPIYVDLLDKKAQEVIGVPLEASKAALHLLENEGFRHQGYIDVFDAGPTMQAERAQIRTIRKSKKAKIAEIKELSGSAKFMLATVRLSDFRMGLGLLEEGKNGISVAADIAQTMGLRVGDEVRFVEA
ncbi:MAG: arginine N-succinyltransferase [Pseudomonadota bacterium]